MKPTLLQYVRKAMLPFTRRGFHLTQKARDCLLRSVAAARRENHFPYDDTLLRGFIEARSVAIPILDSAGVNFHKLLEDIKADPTGYEDVGDHFTYEYRKDIKGGSPFFAIQCAVAIAESRGSKVIDSSVLLESLLRQSFLESPDPSCSVSSKKIKQVAQTFGQQLKQAMSQVSSENADIENKSFGEVVGILESNGWIPSQMLDKLAPHIKDWRAIELIEDSLAFARNVEPYIEEPRHIIIPTRKGFRLRQFDYLNSYALSRHDDDDKFCPSKINTFTGVGILDWGQVEEFEQLINRDNVDEHGFQSFFQKNPGFLLGGEYRKLHGQIALLDDSGNELIPDFFAEHIGARFADIIEIKKPTAKLIVGKPSRRGFSAELTQALNQAREYRNFFDDTSNRKTFHKRYGFEAFRPRLCVVIGRSWDYLDHLERIRIEDEYKNLKVLTFDDILKRAKQLAVIS